MKGLTLLCILSLLLVKCSSQTCNKTISVEMTSNSSSLTLPMVSQVILWTNETGTISWTSSANDPAVNGREYLINTTNTSNWYALTVGSNIYNVTLYFSDSAVSCRSITLDVPLSSRSFTCVPVTSCGNSDDVGMTLITWRKAYYMDNDVDNENEYEDLYSGLYSAPTGFTIRGLSSNRRTNRIEITSSTFENRTIQNATLTLSGGSVGPEELAGYYIAVNDMAEVLYQFTVYYGPILINHVEEEGSAKVTLGRDNYRDYRCEFRSFPNAIVTWSIERDGQRSNINRASDVNLINITEERYDTNVMMPNGSEEYDFTWTAFGGLIITDVKYNHSGVINCTATNGFNMTSVGRRLRVRSPLRPLWPILGIIASFLVTAVFILGGFIVDKIRGESKNTIDQDEIDGAFRPLSVNSFNEEDTKELYRRVSSAKELIPPSEQASS